MKYNLLDDGKTHINIYSKANTFLGKQMSNWYDSTVECSLGEFRCIEGLIFYLGSFNEHLRSMTGYEAKTHGQKFDRNIRLPEDVFKRIIIEAMWSKVRTVKTLKEGLKKSTLPLTHYYNYAGKAITVPKWNWQIEAWENIRKELKNEI